MAILIDLSKKTKLKLGLIFALIMGTGLLRLFLLENINYHLHHIYYHTEYSSMSDVLAALNGFSYDDLIVVKWMLTIFFALVCLGYTLWAIKLIFQNRTYSKIVIYVYCFLIVLSFILYYSGGFLSEIGSGYRMARFVMGIAQSPFPLVALIPVFTLADQK